LEKLRDSAQTEVFYEAPHRIQQTLEDIVTVLGPERKIVVARELTKIHEEFLRGTGSQVLEVVKARGGIKGEITLLIGPAQEGDVQSSAISIRERVAQLMRDEKLDEKAALKKVAKERGISKSEAYREFQRGK
jgi:16S rRNA (cytidine1402-2'-O)-methyltransferase